MAVVHLLAHFDDEYCALPLILERQRAGREQIFLYLADYRTDALSRRRHAETRTLLNRLGLDPERAIHLSRGSGALDGQLYRHLATLLPAVQAAVASHGAVEELVVTAYEGGHMDHDVCALAATLLAPALGHPPITQFSLYNGPGLAGPFFFGGRPLAENGPTRRLRLGPADWARFMAEVGCFPSQARTWAGLWPAMFTGYAARGYLVQSLAPGRVRERPHAGRLFYERMFKVPYEAVRASMDLVLEPGRRPGDSGLGR
jgi:LmbE family N-acetylglucosaminyl deacetylase